MEQVDEQGHNYNPLLKDCIAAHVHTCTVHHTHQHCTLCTNNAPCAQKLQQLTALFSQEMTACSNLNISLQFVMIFAA